MQNLQRAAQLRAIPVEFNAYQTAVTTFRDQYGALPGDITNAADFFGAAGTCPPSSLAPLRTRATCKGDGDGRIEASALTANETFTFWHHLANAGLIDSSYTGTSGSGAYDSPHAIVGANVPASKYADAGWWPLWLGDVQTTNIVFIEGSYNNMLVFGGPVSGNAPYAPILSPGEAAAIDRKIDDGKAGGGKLVVRENQRTCYRLADGQLGESSPSAYRRDVNYAVGNRYIACSLYFRDAF